VIEEPIPIVELPLNATVDRVVGGVDLDRTLRAGAFRFRPGILAAANRSLLYIDEVNLVADAVVDALLDVAASGVNTVAREGIVLSHPSRFALIGTMNAQEGELRPQLLDRFGLCVDVTALTDVETRADVAEREAATRARDRALLEPFCRQDEELRDLLATARRGLAAVKLSKPMARLIGQTCVEANVSGHRADIVLGHAVAALAAMRGRRGVLDTDVFEAAMLALGHRARTPVAGHGAGIGARPRTGDDGRDGAGDDEAVPDPGDRNSDRSDDVGRDGSADSAPQSPSAESTSAAADRGNGGTGGSGQESSDDKRLIHPDAAAVDPTVPSVELPRTRRARTASGKRMKSHALDGRGRYIGARTQNPVTDLAVDATLRAAAVHQAERGWTPGHRLQLRPSDLRQKVREHKVGTLTIFVVDGSASMAAAERMATTKAVILGLLRDAYVRRDKVAAIVFRGRAASVVLEPTGMVTVAQRRLAELSVGGSTPLPHGLFNAWGMARRATRLDPSVRPLLVVITDGHANVPLAGGDARRDAREVADRIGREALDVLLVDTSPVSDPTAKAPMYHDLRPNMCKELALRMSAAYFSMSQMDAGQLGRAVVRLRARR
jgi:magnesium chelatase subunit D